MALGVLQRHIQIRADVFVLGNGLEQTSGDLIGVSVKKANPTQVFYTRQFLQQESQAILQAKIFAVAGRILPYQCNFTHSGAGEALAFRHHRLEATRAEFPSELRNDAEAAGMIAPFSNLDVCGMSSRGQHARRVFVIEIVRQVRNGAVPVFAGKTAMGCASFCFRTRLQNVEGGMRRGGRSDAGR